MKMFRSASHNSFLHRSSNPLLGKDSGNDQYEKFEELESRLSLIRKEMSDDAVMRSSAEDSQCRTLLHLSRDIQSSAQPKINPKQIQEISDRLRYLNLQWKQDIKGNHVKTTWSDPRLQKIKSSAVGPRVRRLTLLSSELRMLSESVLAKDSSDLSISNMSGVTETTVPSCASWEFPNGSSHRIVKPIVDDIDSLSSSTGCYNDGSQVQGFPSSKSMYDESQVHESLKERNSSGSGAELHVTTIDGPNKVAKEVTENVSWHQKELSTHDKSTSTLIQENDLVQHMDHTTSDGQGTSVDPLQSLPVVKETNAPNRTASTQTYIESLVEENQSNIENLISYTKEGICLTDYQSIFRQPVTVLATPTTIASMQSPERMLQVLQLQFVQVGQEKSLLNTETTPNNQEKDTNGLSWLDKGSTVTSQPPIPLSKPPRHPQKTNSAKLPTAHRRPSISKTLDASSKPQEDKTTMESKHDAEDHERISRSHSTSSFQKVVNGKVDESSHRRTRSCETMDPILSMLESMVGGVNGIVREESFQPATEETNEQLTSKGDIKPGPHCADEDDQHQSKKQCKRQEECTTKTTEISERPSESEVSFRRSERSVLRSVDRKPRKKLERSQSLRSSARPTSSLEKQVDQATEKNCNVPKRLERSESRSRESSIFRALEKETMSERPTLRSGERSSYHSVDKRSFERYGEKRDDLERRDSCDAVDLVLKEIRKRQIDRMISQRVGARPLGISMAEERAYQKICGKPNHRMQDDSFRSIYPPDHRLIDTSYYRSRRHGVAEVNKLKLRSETTATRMMEKKDLDHFERRRFLTDMRNEIAAMEKQEKRRQLFKRSIEGRRKERQSDDLKP